MKVSNFISVSGLDILDQIYDEEHNDFELEEVIEDVYKMMTYKASNMQILTLKKGFYKSREKTDGFMTFSLNGKERFYGIQEVKRKVCNSTNQYKKQLLQALRYLWLYKNEPSIKVFVLNSEKFYVYVLREDIEDLINQLSPLFAKSDKSACKTWDDADLRRTIQSYNINFHTTLLRDLELDKTLTEIYKLV
jgi:hypothetical protein